MKGKKIPPSPEGGHPEIDPRQSIELLKELHILTREGKLNQDSRRKLKQVYHLYNFIQPILEEVAKSQKQVGTFTLVDHGAGKSYLGFILYDLFFKQLDFGDVIGIEARAELIKKSQELKEKLQFSRMQFHQISVQDSIQSNEIPSTVEIVTALHACDTATDDAIKFALLKKSSNIILIPCCQAEVAHYLRKNKEKSLATIPLTELWRHPIHTREFGAHITNVLRCLQLEAFGYQVTVTELTGLEHSMKNELILARLKNGPSKKAGEKVGRILSALNLEELTDRFFVPN